MTFRILATPIDPASLRVPLDYCGAGGCAIFEGRVRSRSGARSVRFLEYEAHGALAEAEGARIFAEAAGKFAMLAALIPPFSILGFSGVAAVVPLALKALEASGPHGLSEILYAYTSATGNNGSAFAGLSANVPYWNATLGIAMLLGRFAYVLPVLAMAGAIAIKPKLAPTTGTLPTDGPLFVGLLIGVIIIMGGLMYFPAQSLGPIVEHFQVLQTVAAQH